MLVVVQCQASLPKGWPFFCQAADEIQILTRNGLNQPVTIDGAAATSDARGNLTSDGVKSFVYDSANRLTGTGSSTLSYSPLDRSARRIVRRAGS